MEFDQNANLTDEQRERRRLRLEQSRQQRSNEFWGSTFGQVLIVVVGFGTLFAVGLVAFAILKWSFQTVF